MRSIFALASMLAAMPVVQVSAHHSYAIYDQNAIVTLHGTVTRYIWSSPHVYLFVEVEDAAGEVAEYEIEGDPTPMMTRNGWTATTLRSGDRVTLRANPGRDPDKHQGLLESLTTPGGVVLHRRAPGRAAESQAASIFGVWSGLRGFGTRRFDGGVPTEKGRAAQAAAEGAPNPVAECIPAPPPLIANAPHLHALERLDDRILIRTEYFAVTRNVHMDGRGHPADGERTPQGHSIGRWDGDTLVMDTRLFADHPGGNTRGIPSGARKHLVERYALSDDRRELVMDFVLEDPEYLAEPVTGRFTWDYAPGQELLPSACNPETARRFLLPR
jgi:hypothetical protein